jgi:hypothetical protein
MSRGAGEADGVGRPNATVNFSFFQIFSNGFEFETVKRWSFGA